MEIKVFGMANCAGCETVKRILKGRSVAFIEYDVMNPAHMDEASKARVRGVPTTVISDGAGVHTYVGSTPLAIEGILQHVDGSEV